MCNDKYKVLREFECYGKHMIVVRRMENNVHVMPIDEWKCICKRNFLKQYYDKVRDKIA